MFRACVLLVLVVQLCVGGAPQALACTGIRLKPADGSIITARTLEFGLDLESKLIHIPRGQEYVGTTPDGTRGRVWRSKYAVVGTNAAGLPQIADGLNERGLGVGLFYFPGYAKYQEFMPVTASHSLAPWELGTYLLTTCGSVKEAVEAANETLVVPTILPQAGFVLPLHYVIHDAQGNCAVLEHVDGRLTVHHNPLGVITNSPTFDWHLTNVRNYVNLMADNAEPVTLDGAKFEAFGQGSGMHGLPGDFTPPSRFIRATALSVTSAKAASAEAGVERAFHILNQFDIPLGSVRDKSCTGESIEYTLWTSASDLTNGRFYIHTHDDRQIRMVDLKSLDPQAEKVTSVPINVKQPVVNLSGAMK